MDSKTMFGKKHKVPRSILRLCVWLLPALMPTAFFGCSELFQKQDSEVSDTIVRTYVGTLAPATKTALSSEGSVSWVAGDQIWYFSQDGGQLRSFSVASDAVSASMTLTLSVGATYLVAVYGTSAISDYTKDALTLSDTAPAEQTGVFGDNHIAVARTTQLNASSLLFNNVISFISFSTNRTDVDYVIFSSNDETPLQANGVVNIQFTEGLPSATFGPDRGNSIRVDLNGAGLYYIATLPAEIQNGFTISCYDSGDNLIGTATGQNPLSLNRSSIIRLGLIDNHLVDINGIKLNGYDPDTNWDGTHTSGASMNYGLYGEDYNWDSDPSSGGDLNRNGYNGDGNWDSNTNGNASVGKGGYGNDSSWDSNTGTSGNLGINGYGNDTNWN